MSKLNIADLHPIFRQSTQVVYPPFKKGRYLEEYFYDFVSTHTFPVQSNIVYIPAFWTNIQISSTFIARISIYQKLLDDALSKYPEETQFFTVVQHDDGVMLKLPTNTILFGSCTGHIPLPLIYEDTDNTLINSVNNIVRRAPKYTASFVGTITHPLRKYMTDHLGNHQDVSIDIQGTWTNQVSDRRAEEFIQNCQDSKYILSPRGYGRSSFRYFEAMQLGVVPVYIWDDKEWLPYKEHLDYSKFAISSNINEVPNIYNTLKNISDSEYQAFIEEGKKVAPWFTLEGMSRYIISVILATPDIIRGFTNYP